MTVDVPAVAISLITYNRPYMFEQVLKALVEKLHYPNRIWVISDDGSDTNYVETAHQICKGEQIRILRHKRLGMGGNWNAAITTAENLCDYTFCMQDDWLLTRNIDLRVGVKFLQHNPKFGFIRYHKITGNIGLCCIVNECDTTDWDLQYSDGPNEYSPHKLNYFVLRQNGTNHNPYSGGAHLRHKRFTDFYGQYLEGTKFTPAEWNFMLRVNKMMKEEEAPDIAMFPEFFKSAFKDLAIGKSYRDTEVEKETVK